MAYEKGLILQKNIKSMMWNGFSNLVIALVMWQMKLNIRNWSQWQMVMWITSWLCRVLPYSRFLIV